MTPITKNIRVVDESGKEYEATYPKRAKGLVKNGRARFVDEHRICLVRPPNKNLEDNHMFENITPEDEAIKMTEEINRALNENPQADVGEIVRNAVANYAGEEFAASTVQAEMPTKASALTMDYVLTRIDKVLNDTDYIQSTLIALEDISFEGPGDIASAQKAEAIGEIVKCREATNQKLLSLYEKMYEDLKPSKAHASFVPKDFKELFALANSLPPVQKENFIRELSGLPQKEMSMPASPLKQIREILDEVKSTDWDDLPDDIRKAVAQGLTAQLSRNW